MNKKIMLINATDPEEIRVATLVDGILSDFDIELVHNEKIKGNIYKAKVVRVDTSLQAAFVHFGGQKNGFLPIGELPRDLVSPEGRRGRIQDLLSRDQEIMVQAVREELGTKGAMMTAQISLPGRYLVLTPGNPMNGISRKIESREEREYFKRLIDELEIPKNFGVIVRTASLGVTKEDFQRDLEYLLDTFKEVQARYKHRRGPGLVWQEDDVVTRTLRDGFSADMEEVHIDDLETFHQAQSFFKRTMPQFQNVIKHYTGKKPIFTKHQTEEQIDRIFARRVNLPSGGALVLDQTEALVAVDVNSGKTTGEGVEDMAFKTNMEAAEEAARQLRLRDLAGLIVIDFIDMKREQHNKAVMDRLVDCLKEDKARMEVGKINRFGVLVMTRQRLRPSIQHVTHAACPTCQGTGQVKGLESMAISVIRRLKSALCRDGIAEIRVKLAPAIALAVLNLKRKDLFELEEAHETKITISADHEIGYGEMAAEIERREEESEKPVAKPERVVDTEEETVVLGGDAPISFEKALGENKYANADQNKAEEVRQAPQRFEGEPTPSVRYDRRDAQRAALEERERMRALFESARPGEALEVLPPRENRGGRPARDAVAATVADGGIARTAMPRTRGGRGRVIRDRDPFAGVSGAPEPVKSAAEVVLANERALPETIMPEKSMHEDVMPEKDMPEEVVTPVFNPQLLMGIGRPKLTAETSHATIPEPVILKVNPDPAISEGSGEKEKPRRGRPRKTPVSAQASAPVSEVVPVFDPSLVAKSGKMPVAVAEEAKEEVVAKKRSTRSPRASASSASAKAGKARQARAKI